MGRNEKKCGAGGQEGEDIANPLQGGDGTDPGPCFRQTVVSSARWERGWGEGETVKPVHWQHPSLGGVPL